MFDILGGSFGLKSDDSSRDELLLKADEIRKHNMLSHQAYLAGIRDTMIALGVDEATIPRGLATRQWGEGHVLKETISEDVKHYSVSPPPVSLLPRQPSDD